MSPGLQKMIFLSAGIHQCISYALQTRSLSQKISVCCDCAGVKGIINNSQWCADFHSVSPTSRLQAQSEAIFDAFPTPAVHVRGATYHNNIYGQFSKMARESGVLLAPDIAAAEKLPLISGTDVAAAAAAVLADFKKYAGQVSLNWPTVDVLLRCGAC